jgi:glucose-6-phosphate dehydrogenase assembly protein OpcA
MAPIETTTGPGGDTRWQVRASSINDTVDQLSRIWGSLARHALEPSGAQALGDPRLGSALDRSSEIRVRTRTSVLTLVVVSASQEVQERAVAAVTALASRHPSRAIVLSPGDPDGPSRFGAHIRAACQVPERSSSEICTEEILIRVGGELAQHLASTVAPLLIHDLPVVLWWPDDVPFGTVAFRELAAEADRVLVDSSSFRGDGVERLAGLLALLRSGTVAHDIAWMRLLLWRELLAGLFDHPLLNPELRAIRAIRIDVARPGTQARLSRAALFAGWLTAMLGWSVAEPMAADDDGVLHGALRTGKRDIALEFRPVGVTVEGPVRTAGSLVRVELEAARPRSMLRVRVTRQSDHLLGTADWNGAQVARRAARLEAFDEMPFLAEALDRTARDRVFERALEHAVRLMGATAPADARPPQGPKAARS